MVVLSYIFISLSQSLFLTFINSLVSSSRQLLSTSFTSHICHQKTTLQCMTFNYLWQYILFLINFSIRTMRLETWKKRTISRSIQRHTIDIILTLLLPVKTGSILAALGDSKKLNVLNFTLTFPTYPFTNIILKKIDSLGG